MAMSLPDNDGFKPYEGPVALISLVASTLAIFAARISNLTQLTRVLVDGAAAFAFLSVLTVISATALSVDMSKTRPKFVMGWMRTSLVFLAVAVYLAGFGAETAVLHPQSHPPTITITKTLDITDSSSKGPEITVTVTSSFHGLTSDEVATATIVDNHTSEVLASSAATSAPDGTATVTLAASHIPATDKLSIDIAGENQKCTGSIKSKQSSPDLTCQPNY
jgi:hypothetical protein